MTLKSLLCSVVVGISILACARDASAKKDIPVDWPGSITGKCYPSLSDFVLTTFPWTKDGDDENIQTIEASKTSNGKGAYIWVLDKTAGTNVTRILFRVSEGQACAVLYAPLSSSIDLKIINTKLPDKATSIDTPPPGIEMTRITYKLNSAGTYHPYRCENAKFPTGASKEIDCAEAFRSK